MFKNDWFIFAGALQVPEDWTPAYVPKVPLQDERPDRDIGHREADRVLELGQNPAYQSQTMLDQVHCRPWAFSNTVSITLRFGPGDSFAGTIRIFSSGTCIVGVGAFGYGLISPGLSRSQNYVIPTKTCGMTKTDSKKKTHFEKGSYEWFLF